MANRQDMDSDLKSLIEENGQIMFFAVKAEFDTETIYVWTGNEDISIDGNTYIGAGSLLSVSDVRDSLEMKSEGLTITISGMDETVLNLALTENYQNRFLTVFLGTLSGGTEIVAGKMILFKGRMQSMNISDDPSGAMITIECENRLTDLDKPSNLRYTNQSQKFIDATDTCFSRVQLLQDKEIFWGRLSSGGSVGGAGFRDDTGGANPRIERAK